VSWFLEPALFAAAVGLVTGAGVPELIARIPEPEPVEAVVRDSADASVEVPHEESGDGPGVAAGGPPADPAEDAPPPEEPKELYVDIAAAPGLRWKAAVTTAVVAGLAAARVGWAPALTFVLFLAPVGVALAVVDWRTRLLPTKVIGPSYVVVALLAALCALSDGDPHRLLRAGLGWLVAGGTFFLLWFVYPRGMGYGDVRLSGLLGISLGYLGWPQLLTGVYAAFLVGGVGGLLLSLLRIVDRKAYPFGPFMLVGGLVGVLVGPYVGAWYA
jgi:leader peptidase (prepilin peptidase)/N-methyltransferase